MDANNSNNNEIELDLSSPETLSKYQFAADVANKVIKLVTAEVQPGRKIVDLCDLGDKTIDELVKTRFTKGKMDKGVAFPTSISVNNVAGHYSPLAEDTAVFQEGDLVKIDLAVHIDGYISATAVSTIATANKTAPTTGRKADAICAAHMAAEAALRLIKPGNKNSDVTEAISKIAASFNCTPLEGVLSHQLKRFVIDGTKVIIGKTNPEHRVEEFTFEENEVYAVDIVISTGEGKAKENESKTTIYKRAVEQSYNLKLKAARYVYSEISTRFQTYPFTVRAFTDNRAKFGIVECLSHGLVQPYPVLYEKPGEYIAQFKFTTLVLPTSTQKINPYDLPFVSSQLSITDPEILSLLNTSTKRTNKKKKKTTAKAAQAEDDVAMTD
eukprot:TRINITY_DN1197_c0_g1_i1.p1 TRINITY_DN1197_c0_g1~~TRINITY_DN1197_c0_g1_i1.p1  ORF type:complete len:384 (+),score=226.38 TRINITY_DN1197_c0_g1_i1:77-1228(+)